MNMSLCLYLLCVFMRVNLCKHKYISVMLPLLYSGQHLVSFLQTQLQSLQSQLKTKFDCLFPLFLASLYTFCFAGMHFDIKVAYAAVICHSINTCEFNSANAVISSTKRQQHWVCLGTKEAEEFDIIPGPVPPNIQQGCCHLFIIDFRLTVM